MYGFILMAKGNILEFYSSSESDALEWIEALKSFVILLDLKEELKVLQVIGKGNSAKVNLCERRNGPQNFYALKTVEKSFLKKSNSNLVS